MPKIKEIFAFIATDKTPDDEGVVGALMPDGTWMPFVAADSTRVKQLKPIAQHISFTTKKKITLARFSVREDMEELTP
jgi:hypothetical protein